MIRASSGTKYSNTVRLRESPLLFKGTQPSQKIKMHLHMYLHWRLKIHSKCKSYNWSSSMF